MAGFLIHPSEHFKDVLEAEGQIDIKELAVRLKTSEGYLKRFMEGEESMTELLAKKIAKEFGGTAKIWLALQEAYDKKLEEHLIDYNEVNDLEGTGMGFGFLK